jgi:plastocyanin
MRPAGAVRLELVPIVLVAAGLALIAGALSLAIASGHFSSGARASAGVTVYVNNIGFCGTPGGNCPNPYAIQVATGANVQWLDGEAGLPHSVTECTEDWASCPAPGGFDSGIESDPPGGVYTDESFPQDGIVYYQCQVHGSLMRGLITIGDSETPTAEPSPSPSPTVAATPSPTATAAPTAAPSPTATAPGGARSDVNCDGETDGEDVLALLLHRAGVDAPSAAGSCPLVGAPEGAETKGDLNCDGVIDAGDAVIALRVWAGLSLDGFLPEGCPAP